MEKETEHATLGKGPPLCTSFSRLTFFKTSLRLFLEINRYSRKMLDIRLLVTSTIIRKILFSLEERSLRVQYIRKKFRVFSLDKFKQIGSRSVSQTVLLKRKKVP